VLAKSGFHPPEGTSPIKGFFFGCQVPGTPDCQKAKAVIGPATLGIVQLDTNGKGQTLPGPPGTVYILCVIRNRTNGQSQVWNLKVDLKPGPNSVTLDQRNAT